MATHRVAALVGTALCVGIAGIAHSAERFGIGRPATEAEIAAWNIDIDRDGRKLPLGSGSVAQGRAVFESQCASCHGSRGEGGTGDRLAGGQGTLATAKPVRTVGSFWPYAPTLFDYIRRAMPLNAPQSLSADDVYAVSAYILHLNGLVPDGATLDARSLAAIRMPNRDGFVPDPRPDVKP
ncbi:c-type cytochrome [Methylobacterium pseudosasicola]|uniref:Cytochrome c n=1 Tax=Methylobacterium pseudosasicola TaxID=582667 RepID=A0A1I4QDN2_9HYPH|nr:cytochrome c [Methylobacterium pseudosasicola]SFM37906.1 cytochrome c [Methylobacterium pseudosasicola]